jgi:AmpD protein
MIHRFSPSGLTLAVLVCLLLGSGTAQAALSLHSAPLPSFSPAARRSIDTVLVHFISAINLAPADWDSPTRILALLRDHKLSAHYLIDRAGGVYRLVEERHIAWHAGGSIMPAPDNRRNVNRFSIGIELIATSASGFTAAQYQSLALLIDDIAERHPIRHILGHRDVAGTRAVRLGLRAAAKVDPGPLFDWARLQAARE